MKKLSFVAALAIAAATFASCGNSTPKADMKNDVDSMSYCIGLVQSQYIRQAIEQGQVIDTAYIDEFIKGINEGANAGDDKKKTAYYTGLQIGQQLSTQLVKGVNYNAFGSDSTKTISLKNLLAGFLTGVKGKKGIMTIDQAQMIAQEKMKTIKTASMKKEFGANKAAGEKFLAENKKKPGVVTLPSGLQYKVIKEGSGTIPSDTTKVKVHYEGRTIDGKVFESSYKNGQPVEIQPKQFIKGWTEALTHMPAGSIWEVYIPQNLGYGERQAGDIKPFSTLIFKIELISVGK